ncbi:MAG: hypothetical protein K2X11_18355 [Acetobacteraceae bacterium]|nr:hypothetical protein [Acetobacteraceae bacterium]
MTALLLFIPCVFLAVVLTVICKRVTPHTPAAIGLSMLLLGSSLYWFTDFGRWTVVGLVAASHAIVGLALWLKETKRLG